MAGSGEGWGGRTWDLPVVSSCILLSGDGIQYGWKSRGSDIFVEKV